MVLYHSCTETFPEHTGLKANHYKEKVLMGIGSLAVGAFFNFTVIGWEKSLSSKMTNKQHICSLAIYVPLQVYVSVWARSEVMLRREPDSHGLFSSGETSDNDCEVRSWAWNPISFMSMSRSADWSVCCHASNYSSDVIYIFDWIIGINQPL